MFALWIAVALNGQLYEAIPALFKTKEDCQEYRTLYNGHAESSKCFYIPSHLVRHNK